MEETSTPTNVSSTNVIKIENKPYRERLFLYNLPIREHLEHPAFLKALKASDAARAELRLAMQRLGSGNGVHMSAKEFAEISSLITAAQKKVRNAERKREMFIDRICVSKVKELNEMFKQAGPGSGFCHKHVPGGRMRRAFLEIPSVLVSAVIGVYAKMEALGFEPEKLENYPLMSEPNEDLDNLFKHDEAVCECSKCIGSRERSASGEQSMKEAEAECAANTPVDAEAHQAAVRARLAAMYNGDKELAIA